MDKEAACRVDPKVVRRLKALASKIKADSYWKQSFPGEWTRYIHFHEEVTLGNDQDALGEHLMVRAAFIDEKGNSARREHDNLGFTYSTSITWKETTKDRFDFWWNISEEN